MNTNENKHIENPQPTPDTIWVIASKTDNKAQAVKVGAVVELDTYVYLREAKTYCLSGFIKGTVRQIGEDAPCDTDYICVLVERNKSAVKTILPMNIIEQDGVKPEPTKSQLASKLNTGSHGSDIESRITVLKSQTSSLIRKRDKMTEEIKDNQRRLKKLEKMLAEFKKI